MYVEKRSSSSFFCIFQIGGVDMKKIIYLLLLSLFLVSCSNQEETITYEEDPIEKEEEKQVEKMFVDEKGAVLNPGVYEFEEGNVQDAIAKAGGLLENADTNYLNLSKRLKDEMVILVYTREEIEAFEKGESMELPIETCVCPEITNDGCLKEEEVVSNKPAESVAEGEEEPHVISILTATKEEWMLLPGIGETKAEAIIQYRDEHGFQSIEDVKKVSGIGDSTFEKIKEYLTM